MRCDAVPKKWKMSIKWRGIGIIFTSVTYLLVRTRTYSNSNSLTLNCRLVVCVCVYCVLWVSWHLDDANRIRIYDTIPSANKTESTTAITITLDASFSFSPINSAWRASERLCPYIGRHETRHRYKTNWRWTLIRAKCTLCALCYTSFSAV